MIRFRSLLFNVFFYPWLTVLLTTFWVFLPFPKEVMLRAIRIWAYIALAGMRVTAGIGIRVVGREHIPKGAAVIACKHQSIWETFVFFTLLDMPQYVLKQELTRIPFWGWYADKTEAIAVDRDAGAKALRSMVAACVDRLQKGRQVIIFPEGTRTAPGQSRRYHPGVAAIYKALPDGVPVVPAALNSGVHWGRRKFLVKPGVITLEFLEPIQPGLDRKEFAALLEERIETASTRLLDAG